MQTRSLIVLALGIVIALGTAWSLRSRMQSSGKEQTTSQVLVATTDIPAGSFVRSDANFAFVDWPEKNISETMLTHATAKATDFDGAVARRAINKGEPIAASMLVKSNEGGFMSAVLEPGKRAISISVDETTGNAGFIFPGDRVDLLLTHSITVGGQIERASETFAEDVRILAVDQMLDNPENKAVLAKTVTIEVTPKQAERVNVAKDLGKISLSLRSLAKQTEGEQAIEAEAIDQGPDDLNSYLESVSDMPGAPGDVTTAPVQNVTRDTDVSKVIIAPNAAGSRVRVLRAGEVEEIEFGEKGGANAPQ